MIKIYDLFAGLGSRNPKMVLVAINFLLNCNRVLLRDRVPNMFWEAVQKEMNIKIRAEAGGMA